MSVALDLQPFALRVRLDRLASMLMSREGYALLQGRLYGPLPLPSLSRQEIVYLVHRSGMSFCPTGMPPNRPGQINVLV